MNETDGKGTVSKVGYLFDNPASFRKLEIEPNAFLNSHGQAAPWYEGVQGQSIGERLEWLIEEYCVRYNDERALRLLVKYAELEAEGEMV